MKYLGGKNRLAKFIVPILEHHRKDGQIFFEPFVGGANIVSKMTGLRIASDVDVTLYHLYRALQHGWVPPDFISEDEYDEIKINQQKYIDAKSPLTAFVAYGCSFGGKKWGGYARGENRAYAMESKRNLMAKAKTMEDVIFTYGDYELFQPKDMLIYCDPPYMGTTEYKGATKFNSVKFWNKMLEWSKDNTVFVSEYTCPLDIKPYITFNHKSSIANNHKDSKKNRVENLYLIS